MLKIESNFENLGQLVDIHRKFWNIFIKGTNKNSTYNKTHKKIMSSIGSNFLQKNTNFQEQFLEIIVIVKYINFLKIKKYL